MDVVMTPPPALPAITPAMMSCSLCYDTTNTILAFPCHRHTACKTCMVQLVTQTLHLDADGRALRAVASSCPFCKTPLKPFRTATDRVTPELRDTGIVPLADVVYDSYDAITIRKCDYCEYRGTLKELCNHYLACPYLEYPCPRCNLPICIKTTFKQHCTTVCLRPKCRFCDFYATRDAMQEHETIHEHLMHIGTLLRLVGDRIMRTVPSEPGIQLHPLRVVYDEMSRNPMLRHAPGFIDLIYEALLPMYDVPPREVACQTDAS
jgi:hypothetical protein